jgi:hypothetical protein
MQKTERICREINPWRGVVSAWAVAAFVVVGFAGLQALASLRPVPPRPAHFAGVVIPHHNPTCADGQCRAAPGPFDGIDGKVYATW